MGGFQMYERPAPDEELFKWEEGGVVHYSINPGNFVRILEIADVREHKLETIIPCTTEVYVYNSFVMYCHRRLMCLYTLSLIC
jgi:hypothetical protein